MFVPEEINPLSLNWVLALKSISPATKRNPYNGLLGFVSVAGILGVTGYSLFKGYTWESGNLNDAPHGITYIHCWENTGSFTNMPISDRNANAILYSFRSEPRTNEINSAIQFFLHGHTTGVCYFRCYSNGNWSAWKVIS